MDFIQKLTTMYKAFKSRVTKSIWWRERPYTKYMDFAQVLENFAETCVCTSSTFRSSELSPIKATKVRKLPYERYLA